MNNCLITFDTEIDNLRKTQIAAVNSAALTYTTKISCVNRIEDITSIIRLFFKSFLPIEFDRKIIKQHDIKQSICKYIENLNSVSAADLKVINIFIVRLSEFSLDIDYIIENYQALKLINDCEHNTHIISLSF